LRTKESCIFLFDTMTVLKAFDIDCLLKSDGNLDFFPRSTVPSFTHLYSVLKYYGDSTIFVFTWEFGSLGIEFQPCFVKFFFIPQSNRIWFLGIRILNWVFIFFSFLNKLELRFLKLKKYLRVFFFVKNGWIRG